jgi:hypothetical protein
VLGWGGSGYGAAPRFYDALAFALPIFLRRCSKNEPWACFARFPPINVL